MLAAMISCSISSLYDDDNNSRMVKNSKGRSTLQNLETPAIGIQRVSNIEKPERIVAVTLGQAGRLEKFLMYGRHSKHTIKRSYCW